MNTKLSSAIALAVLGVAAASAPAIAATATANFQVKMTILKSCSVVAGTASDIDLGSVNADYTGVSSGSNTIHVTCSKTTPYYIGLRPSNNSTTGAGVMSGTGGNTDQVPYQLASDGSGTNWGDTATSTSVGNGVAGLGSGLAQDIPVYATAPSANFTPDTYADTVTVNVNF